MDTLSFQAYWAALVLGFLLALICNSRGMKAAGTVLLLDAAASLVVASATGFNHDRVSVLAAHTVAGGLGFGLTHFLCAVMLLRDNRSTPELVIAGIYFCQFVTDGVYVGALFLHGVAGTATFLDWQAGAGWLQIGCLILGSAADGPGKWLRDNWRWHPRAVGRVAAVAVAATAAGVAKAWLP